MTAVMIARINRPPRQTMVPIPMATVFDFGDMDDDNDSVTDADDADPSTRFAR